MSDSHPFLGPSNHAAPMPNGYTLSQDARTPQPSAGGPKNVAPPGWKHTVEEMKGKPGIDNPFALAWWMKGHGAHPHK